MFNAGIKKMWNRMSRWFIAFANLFLPPPELAFFVFVWLSFSSFRRLDLENDEDKISLKPNWSRKRFRGYLNSIKFLECFDIFSSLSYSCVHVSAVNFPLRFSRSLYNVNTALCKILQWFIYLTSIIYENGFAKTLLKTMIKPQAYIFQFTVESS